MDSARRFPFTVFVVLPLLACGARSDLLGSDGQGGEGASPATGNTTASSPVTGTTGTGGEGGDGGGCVALASDVLDPGQVYLSGTTHVGLCGSDALVNLCDPSSAVVGFDCEYNALYAVVRPADGRLLYDITLEGQIREFRCDGCPFSGGTYPADPFANDPILPGFSCGFQNGFYQAPDGGVIRWCGDGLYYDESGSFVYPFAAATKPQLYHVGYGGQALAIGFILNLNINSEVPIVGIPQGTYLTARAQPDGGFWIAFQLDGEASLYSVSPDGFATQLGVYPPPPPNVDVYWYSAKIDFAGALYELGIGQNTLDDVVVRRPLDGGPSEIVFNELEQPLVQIHGGYLITGP